MAAKSEPEMFTALAARGPHPDMAPAQNIFGWLAGGWDVEVFDIEQDGAKRVSTGEWHFAWVLEGRAMQDVLIAPPRAARRPDTAVKANRYGTSLRIFDAAQDAWRVHWFNPVARVHEAMTARKQGDEIVQMGEGDFRFVFVQLTDDQFRCRREKRLADGQWSLTDEFAATRRR